MRAIVQKVAVERSLLARHPTARQLREPTGCRAARAEKMEEDRRSHRQTYRIAFVDGKLSAAESSEDMEMQQEEEKLGVAGRHFFFHLVASP